MYARRYQRPKTHPLAIAAAAAVNIGMVALIATSAPHIGHEVERTLEAWNVPIAPPPEPTPPEPAKRTTETPSAESKVVVPEAVVPLPTPTTTLTTTNIPVEQPLVSDPIPLTPGPANGAVAVAAPKPLPVVVAAQADPRATFQPDYPAAERRAGTEGSVTVRVLIGTDGRVKAVEQVGSASPAFFEATRRQALGRWRFRPATRDGEPVESWQVKTLRFVMES
ncbi:protein TonB [Sphingomonas guangdongensis]|uniref:Protein TonB n=1 Tax=Sphingomonas guangdongensis TaxID=1141890 RepID=A0A285QEC4_9SPHN|nr:energy transducer TonB [Sphingomonas guangdongensis]SOB80280.1 protein TonB [Sphingomonas guangdongensis]